MDKELTAGAPVDKEGRLQKELLAEEWFACHPCVNTSSLRMRLADVLEKFLPAVHHDYRSVELPEYAD